MPLGRTTRSSSRFRQGAGRVGQVPRGRRPLLRARGCRRRNEIRRDRAEGRQRRAHLRMKAAVRDRFGSPGVVEVREVETLTPADNELLVRVRASSLNLGDWYAVTGRPYLARGMMGFRKPKDNRLGYRLRRRRRSCRQGRHAVPGRRRGVRRAKRGWAEFVTVPRGPRVVPKPANVTFDEAGGVPVAALTALQAARDKGGFSRARRSSSTARPEASARSRCRSPRHSGVR